MKPTLIDIVLLVAEGRPTLLAGNLPAHLQPFPWEERNSSQPIVRWLAGRGKNLLLPQKIREAACQVLHKYRHGELLRTLLISVFVSSSRTKKIYTLIIKNRNSHTYPHSLTQEHAFHILIIQNVSLKPWGIIYFQTTEINFTCNFLWNSVSNTLFDTLCSYLYLLIFVMIPREKGKQVSMAYFGLENKRTPDFSAPFSSPKPKPPLPLVMPESHIPQCSALMYYLVVVSSTLMQAFVFQSSSDKAEQYYAQDMLCRCLLL